MRTQVIGQQASRWLRPVALKVPAITVWFWVIKLLSTAMGESTSDFLVFHINPYVAVVLGSLGLVLAVAIQLAVPRYQAPVYWFAVVMIAVFGTMIADVLHVVVGIPYAVSTAALGTAAGDLVASTLGVGYGPAAVIFAIAFVVPAIGYRWLGWNAIVAFWAAYIITRPLGASIADWLGKPSLGGLGLGDEKVAIVLTACIVLAVGYVTVTRVDVGTE